MAKNNLTAVAEELGCSLSTASARLSSLERDLDRRLFHRASRRLQPTADAYAFLPHAQAALQSLETGRHVLNNAQQRLTGVLRLSASASLTRQILAPLLAQFHRQHPDLIIQLVASDSVLDLLGEGLDMAIRLTAAPPQDSIARPLAPSPRIIVAAPSYLRRCGEPQTPEQLVAHACLILNRQSRWRLRAGDQVSEIQVSGPLYCDHGESLREAAQAGMGICLQSLWNVGDRLSDGRLVRVLADYQLDPPSTLYAIFPGPDGVTARARALAEFLQIAFRDFPVA